MAQGADAEMALAALQKAIVAGLDDEPEEKTSIHSEQSLSFDSVLGSAITSGLSMLFGCSLCAPHGGIFVLAIPNAVSQGGLYVIAIAVGTLVTAVAVTQFKRWRPKSQISPQV